MEPLEVNFALPVVHEIINGNDRVLLNVAFAAEVNLAGDPALAAADAAREAGNAPNSVMAAAASINGPKRVERALACTDALIDRFAHSGLSDARDETFDLAAVAMDAEIGSQFLATSADQDVMPHLMIKAVRDPRRQVGVHQDTGESWSACASGRGPGGVGDDDRLGPANAQAHFLDHGAHTSLVSYIRLYGAMIGASIPGARHQRGALLGFPCEARFETWTMADLAFLAITGKKPTEAQARQLQMLIGLLISNGPGTISAQGAKGAASADGPQSAKRVQINKAMVGFLSHTGYCHGGNCFEGIAFLLDVGRAVMGQPELPLLPLIEEMLITRPKFRSRCR